MAEFRWLWSAKHHARWARTRAHGRARFVLVYGLLGWGLPMFAITGVVAPLLQTPQGELTARHLGEQAVLWGVGGGLCFGLAVWSIAERLYRTHTH